MCFSHLFAVMTRWARANNVHRQKPAEATPWSQLRGRGGRAGGRTGGQAAGATHGAQRDPLKRTEAAGSGMKKPNRKKKDYTNEDVNGFLEYLQQSGQSLPAAEGGGKGEEHQLREEVEVALKKDRKREDRRIKRQNDKRNKMVSNLSFLCTVQSNDIQNDRKKYVVKKCLSLLLRCVLSAGSPVTVWPTVPRLTKMRRWAETSATAVAPLNMRSTSAEPKWIRRWVRLLCWTYFTLSACNAAVTNIFSLR